MSARWIKYTHIKAPHGEMTETYEQREDSVASRGKKWVSCKGTKVKKALDFSTATLEAGKQ